MSELHIINLVLLRLLPGKFQVELQVAFIRAHEHNEPYHVSPYFVNQFVQQGEAPTRGAHALAFQGYELVNKQPKPRGVITEDFYPAYNIRKGILMIRSQHI